MLAIGHTAIQPVIDLLDIFHIGPRHPYFVGMLATSLLCAYCVQRFSRFGVGAVGPFAILMSIVPPGVYRHPSAKLERRYTAFVDQLLHTNVWLNFPRWLRPFLLSPAQHQIHHSNAPHHYDKNFGQLIAIFDYLAGTLYYPEEKEELSFGLANGESAQFRTVGALFFQPFKNIFRRIRGKAPLSA